MRRVVGPATAAAGRTIEFRDRLGKERGRSVTTRGLYSDMLTSPYIAHGVDSHEKFLFRKCGPGPPPRETSWTEVGPPISWGLIGGQKAELLAFGPPFDKAGLLARAPLYSYLYAVKVLAWPACRVRDGAKGLW